LSFGLLNSAFGSHTLGRGWHCLFRYKLFM
jgi:hypothetical protein